MTNEISIEEKIGQLEFDIASVQRYAGDGKLEDWVHKYLMTEEWKNSGLSEGLKLQKRWWNGPVEIPLTDISRVVGPEPGMEYQVTNAYWYERTSKMAKSMMNLSAIPPLIVEYRSGQLSLRDGNTRHRAMTLLGWPTCWVLIWYNNEHDYQKHTQLLPTAK